MRYPVYRLCARGFFLCNDGISVTKGEKVGYCDFKISKIRRNAVLIYVIHRAISAYCGGTSCSYSNEEELEK